MAELTHHDFKIAESFRRFGVSETTGTLLAIKVSNIPNVPANQPDPSTHLGSSVEGTRIDFSDANLRDTADLARVRKIYKLNLGSTPKSGKGPQQLNGVHQELDECKEMEAVILGVMALKGS